MFLSKCAHSSNSDVSENIEETESDLAFLDDVSFSGEESSIRGTTDRESSDSSSPPATASQVPKQRQRRSKRKNQIIDSDDEQPTFEDITGSTSESEFCSAQHTLNEKYLEALRSSFKENNDGGDGGDVAGTSSTKGHLARFYSTYLHADDTTPSSNDIASTIIRGTKKIRLGSGSVGTKDSRAGSSRDGTSEQVLRSRFTEYLKGGHIVHELFGFNKLRKRVIHDIYLKGDAAEYKRGIAKAMELGYSGEFFCVSEHSDHIHVVHDCRCI